MSSASPDAGSRRDSGVLYVQATPSGTKCLTAVMAARILESAFGDRRQNSRATNVQQSAANSAQAGATSESDGGPSLPPYRCQKRQAV